MIYKITEKPEEVDYMNDCLAQSKIALSNDKTFTLFSIPSHCHVSDNKLDYVARNRLIVVLILCAIFIIIEVVGMLLIFILNFIKTRNFYSFSGGILSNSTAVITDAAHMCIDATSFLISLTAIYLAGKRPTQRLSFGYIRAGFIVLL